MRKRDGEVVFPFESGAGDLPFRSEEALDCFLRTEMDMLVLGNYVVTRHQD